ncbi:zinc-ribbon domain-containing protein [Butyrivibrio sp. WCE2006]|uniref:zinc-ribbon domain-containing protein n=1 Tax=Butyrivibrio sp. WCE2006 TaxID=1410611 RepID=UPI0018CC3D2F|nr:zinc-ribbon domain-containing protein [Butyrivibrio sp. WCE2006]
MEDSLAINRPDLVLEWDKEKNIGIRPDEVTCGSERKVWWICSKHHNFDARINNRVRFGSGCPYCAGQKPVRGENDLATIRPEIVDEWDLEKNDGLMPSEVLPKSNKKVWWLCNEGHSYLQKICIRTNPKATGCPYCAGRKLIRGKNDLATLFPDIAKQWDYQKNGNLEPSEVFSASKQKIWWVCESNHSYKASLNSRTSLNRGCPYCAGKKVIKGENDLATICPDIVKEWDYIKNKEMLPSEIPVHSSKKVWWICAKGHSYKAYVYRRTNKNGTGCPYCSGNKPIIGETDLQSTYPKIAKEWDKTRNMGLMPSDVSARSEKKVWWLCEKGHSYEARVSHRTYMKGSSCPYCIGKKAIRGETDLVTLRPDIASQWDFDKNGDLHPTYYTVYSNKKVWWLCEKGHSYRSSLDNRTFLNRGCPYCAGKKPIKGETDLATLDPDTAKLWNYQKNINLKPTDVTSCSGKKVWWKCSQGHEWRTSPHAMKTSLGCPICVRMKG